jgi:plasmid maintenance system antidote protein VapI
MEKTYRYSGGGLDKKEKRWGSNRFYEYLKNYPHLHKMSDLTLLEELIFQEALHERIKSKMWELTNGKKITEEFPSDLQDAFKKSIDLQFKLKEKLGLFEDKKKLDAFKDFQETEEKFKQYRKENPDLFKVTCVKCAFPFYLKRRTENYEPLTGSWFKDKVLFNLPLFKKYQSQEVLTKLDMAEILGVSEYYIDYIVDKFLTKKEDAEETAEPQSETAASDNSVIPENPSAGN